MEVDRKLIEACIKGDRKAQHKLYKDCFAQLLSICYRFANNKDDACILLNGAFFKVLNNLHKQNEEIPFMSWAIRITVNHCISEYRKENTRKKHLTPVDPEDLEHHAELRVLDEGEKEYNPEVLKRVQEEVLNLPPTTQEVFQLYVFQGFTHNEVAQQLDMKEGTSKWHLNNARKILKSVLSSSLKLMSSIVL
ncbi:MAG: hypothetical protein CL840_06870 [Crocinitomicaceae bacterium]|nr:hypothetical protein [Crocinitomicaceae bacterium]|tara:strand:+ start:1451 stop:2029 length:579 start_codon:yes stop_codon:yes gene_type:complete